MMQCFLEPPNLGTCTGNLAVGGGDAQHDIPGAFYNRRAEGEEWRDGKSEQLLCRNNSVVQFLVSQMDEAAHSA